MRAFLMIVCLATPVLVSPALASEDIADKYPGSPLYNKPVEVIPGVWSAIGATAPPTFENAGHNNNLSFIVTGEGVVVVNSGASYALAEALHAEIRAVTDEPVRLDPPMWTQPKNSPIRAQVIWPRRSGSRASRPRARGWSRRARRFKTNISSKWAISASRRAILAPRTAPAISSSGYPAKGS